MISESWPGFKASDSDEKSYPPSLRVSPGLSASLFYRYLFPCPGLPRALLPSLFPVLLVIFLRFSICQPPGSCPLTPWRLNPHCSLIHLPPVSFYLVLSQAGSFSRFCSASWMGSNPPAPCSLVPVAIPSWCARPTPCSRAQAVYLLCFRNTKEIPTSASFFI